MSDFNVCRICLRMDGKMYEYKKYHLNNFYEEIMAKKVSDIDNHSQQFCYECSGLLYKFHKFKEKCYRGLKVLNDIAWRGTIPYDTILSLNRKALNLESQLSIIQANDNVRMDIIKHKSASTKSKINEIPNIENVDIDIQSNDSDKYDINIDSDYDPIEKVVFDERNGLKSIETIQNGSKDIVDVTIQTHFGRKSESTNLKIDLIERGDSYVKKNVSTKCNITIEANNDILEKNYINEKNDLKCMENVINVSKDINKSKIRANNGFQDDKLDTVISGDEVVSTDDEKPLMDLKKHIKIDKKNKTHGNTKKRKLKEDNKYDENKIRFKLQCKKNKFLESNNWQMTFLTEEEAMKVFMMKAQDEKFLKAPYKCDQCFKKFSQQDMLDRHKKLRHEESIGPIECRFCHMRFKFKCLLTKHMSRHYIIYKCLRCDLVCNLNSSAEFHENYHNGIIKKCKFCCLEFTHQSTYYSHLRTHRSQHICHQCGASFVSEAGLHMHRLIKQHLDNNKSQDGAENKSKGDTYCERCDIKFETNQAYEEHLFHSAMHSKGLPDHMDDSPAPAAPKIFRTKPRKPRRKPTSCNYCDEMFSTQTECMKHHHAQHFGKPFWPNEQRYICEICGASLAAASVLPHLNNHTREREYTCATCGIKFSAKSSLTRHLLVHTGEKPFPCPSCDKRFTQSSSVKLHYRRVHLKEPYPKRNRRRKNDEINLAEDFSHAIESVSSRRR